MGRLKTNMMGMQCMAMPCHITSWGSSCTARRHEKQHAMVTTGMFPPRAFILRHGKLDAVQGAGLNLRGDIIGAFKYRTIIILCEGAAIATAKALIEADSSVGGLNFPLRENVVMYYRVGSHLLVASVLYASRFVKYGSLAPSCSKHLTCVCPLKTLP